MFAIAKYFWSLTFVGIVKICAVRNSPKSEIRGKSSAARRLGGVRGDPLTVLHRRQAAGVY